MSATRAVKIPAQSDRLGSRENKIAENGHQNPPDVFFMLV
jgi:hypothetical protein